MAGQATDRLALPVRPSHGKGAARQLLNAKGMGRSNPLYEFLELYSTDIIMFFDDFEGATLNAGSAGTLWAVSNSGGGSVSDFAIPGTNTWRGIIEGDPGADNNAGCNIIGDDIVFAGTYRPAVEFRLEPQTVADSKFECGFTDAVDQTGAVLVKATPTANATDFAVAVYDTNDDDSLDLHSDGTTDGSISTAAGWDFSVNSTTDGSILTVLVTIDETRSCRLWINGNFIGRTTTGPDATTAQYPWVLAMNRTNSSHKLQVDYIRIWQERVAIL